ncbi:MAG TPA: 3-dehydroquinate synthase [Tenuifilaceae bacterium]|nr:3-dehydroquinate synthase [Tenuifilaceae bacterium]
METIQVKGSKYNSVIYVGERLENLAKLIPGKGVFIITDSNIDRIYGNRLPPLPKFVVNPGEQSKTLLRLTEIYRWLLDSGADRNSFIVGIGGGVVCDITGFVASTYMRGVRFGFVATSLLAQVDASIGGKNGVNLDGYKNIVGTFNQPQFVICDTSLLKTLPETELSNGFAEMVKHALIADAPQFNILESNTNRLNTCDLELLDSLVASSVGVKASIVTADERESGERKKLNFGHTWGHAVEKVTGIPHGQAVSIGMAFASQLSAEKGLLTPDECHRITSLLIALNLPVSIKANTNNIFEALQRDKKRCSNAIDFILLEGIGKAVIKSLSLVEIKEFIERKYCY